MQSLQSDVIKLTLSDGVATLSLNRPQARNAINPDMIRILTQQLLSLQKNEAVKILILKGEGEHFSAGADIHWMRDTAQYTREKNLEDALDLAKLLYTLYHFNKPTLALVQGTAFGGALGLIASCDIALADNSAVFCLSEVKLGLTPAVISPYVIRAIGERQARRYMLTAESIPAITALNLGLIHEVIESKSLHDRLEYFIHLLKQNAPGALRATKALIHGLSEIRTPNALMEYTAELIAHIRTTDEAQEGLSAFLEKRTPHWQEH